MPYRFVFTVENAGSTVSEMLEAAPGWQDVSACFPPDIPFSIIEEYHAADDSYVEFTAWFADREMYELWHEAHAALHDESRETAINYLEAQGATVMLYNEGVDLSSPNRSRPIEEFVTRFPKFEV